jgi:2-amino-4-hydroxy-6-hydroxymethyldihydropteridine diphosphokinase
MSVTAYLALGSNLGDRQETLNAAVASLNATNNISVTAVSCSHETLAVGGPLNQPNYLNAAAKIETNLTPEQLLSVLLDIERRFGRIRSERNAPRTLDLDILIYGDHVQSTPELEIPHPRMHQRLFVLEPLAEIAPQVRHPVLKVSIRRLCDHYRRRPLADRPLTGRTALVTGATSGIGRAIANALAEQGAFVLIHGRDAARAAEVVESLHQFDVAAIPMLYDLSVPKQVDALADAAWLPFDGVDILVCNAGVDTLTGEAAAWPFDRKLAELWAVDVQSTIQLSRSIGCRMRERHSGVIVTMGWDQADTGMEGDSGQLFAATKGAVMSFTRSLAKSLAPQVRVNCIAPGWIKTAWGEGASEVWQRRAIREAPLERWGTPEDVAGAVRWLCSDSAAFITGQVIRVNGGAVM